MRIPAIEADIVRREDTRGDNFRASVNGKTYTERVKVGELLLDQLALLEKETRAVKDEKIGAIGGFDLLADAWGEKPFRRSALVIRREGGGATEVEVSGSARGLVQSIENVLRDFENELDYVKGRVIRDYEARSAGEFTGQAEIDRLTEAVRALERELAPKEQKPAANFMTATSEYRVMKASEWAADSGVPIEGDPGRYYVVAPGGFAYGGQPEDGFRHRWRTR